MAKEHPFPGSSASQQKHLQDLKMKNSILTSPFPPAYVQTKSQKQTSQNQMRFSRGRCRLQNFNLKTFLKPLSIWGKIWLDTKTCLGTLIVSFERLRICVTSESFRNLFSASFIACFSQTGLSSCREESALGE